MWNVTMGEEIKKWQLFQSQLQLHLNQTKELVHISLFLAPDNSNCLLWLKLIQSIFGQQPASTEVVAKVGRRFSFSSKECQLA